MEQEKKQKPFGARMGEASFCIIYLIYIFVVAYNLWGKYKMSDTIDYIGTWYVSHMRYLSGFVMSMLLGCGDAFHLVPRIIVNIKGEIKNQEFYLGLGNLISSITMTVFYLVMVNMIKLCTAGMASGGVISNGFVVVTALFVAVRIILCLFPQNRWFTKEGNKRWAVIRNAPFIVVGVMAVIALIIAVASASSDVLNVTSSAIPPVAFIGKSFYIQIMIATILSFAFYLPVAIKGKENPKLGMLMMPKTICYMWMMGVICWG
ncbi:MAG: hypothetical protein IJ661_12635 [Lachnospiraceae bacterium]|nr:hypothetical protein [Lachnospiraceae bacterium]